MHCTHITNGENVEPTPVSKVKGDLYLVACWYRVPKIADLQDLHAKNGEDDQYTHCLIDFLYLCHMALGDEKQGISLLNPIEK